MSIDEVYKILYCQDGTCNRSYSVINILESIVTENLQSNPSLSRSEFISVNTISRWNLYLPSSIHIVYTVLVPSKMNNNGVKNVFELESKQLICQVSDFESKYKEYQREVKLDELGI